MTTTTKPKRRSRRKDATPIETIASALASADLLADAEIAKRFGVSKSTIATWRRRAASDPELAASVRKARLDVHEDWRVEAAATAIAIARRVRALISAGEEVPFSLIAAAKVYGAMNIEAGALLGPPGTGRDDEEDPPRPEPARVLHS